MSRRPQFLFRKRYSHIIKLVAACSIGIVALADESTPVPSAELLPAKSAPATATPSPTAEATPTPEGTKVVQSASGLPKTGVLNNGPVFTEGELLSELGIKDQAAYQKSLQTLIRVINETLSVREFRQLEERCKAFADPTIIMPLSEPTNLPCIPIIIQERFERTAIAHSADKKRKTRKFRAIRSMAEWESFAANDFSETFRSIQVSKLSDLETFAQYFRETTSDCRFRHAGGAIIAQAESFLPSDSALNLMEEVYEKIQPCMRPSDDGYERTHLRMGLLRLSRSDLAKAKKALQQAALAIDPKEEHRSLFWLGVITAYDKGFPQASSFASEYWNLLIRRHPLEIHSILASQILGKDPLKNLVNTTTMQWRRRSEAGTDDVDLANIVTELLVSTNSKETAQHWISFEQRYVDSASAEKLLYMGLLANRVESYRESIYYLSRYIRETREENVNFEFLNIYFPRSFADLIISNSGEIDPVLVFALIRQESAFNRFARSGANARGLMQLLPITARRYKRIHSNKLYDPETNIQIGTKFLENLLQRYEGKVELVLSAYNAGPSNIDRWQERIPILHTLLFSDLIPFRETRFYVSSILRNAYWYGRLLTMQQDQVANEITEKSRQAKWKSQLVHSLLSSVWSGPPNDLPTDKQLLSVIAIQPTPNWSVAQPTTPVLKDLIQELPDFAELDAIQTKQNDREE